jgi:hypothetical protein
MKQQEVKTAVIRDRGLSRQQVAELTGLRAHHLANLAVLNQGPPFRKHQAGKRGRVIYLESEVLAWLRALPVHGGGHAEARRANP